jgi:hypothetical protein
VPADLQPIRDVSTLQRGDHLDIHRFGYPTYSGTVVATMPKFKVVWVRATTTGERIMLCADDCQLRRLLHPGIHR